ncbi:hypothetical protein EB001_16075 [bacterium]|nr:hypothetical protein [bacterium]
MGRNFAEALANVEGLDIEGAIIMHLQSNHYPPVPAEMATACIQAIACYNNEFDTDLPIALPEIDGFQVTYKGRTTMTIQKRMRTNVNLRIMRRTRHSRNYCQFFLSIRNLVLLQLSWTM